MIGDLYCTYANSWQYNSSEKYTVQIYYLQVKVNADDTFNGMSAEESDTQSEEKEEESDTVEEDESKKQNQPEKKGQ